MKRGLFLSTAAARATRSIAYGSLYPAHTVPHRLTFTTPSHRHSRRHTFALLPTTALSSCPLLQNPNFLTGNRNSPFRGMERYCSGSSINRNKGMVDHLKSYGVIKSKRVAEVMETIDRALFVPSGNPPYVDSPLSIGYNATISAPHMHAMCLQLLQENLQAGMRALDVGSGTGYLTACFGLMVGPQGRAVGVEHIPELVSSSITNIEKSAAGKLLKEGSLSVHLGDGRQGWPEFAPYDAIHVGAAAPEIPQPLIDQLRPGGRMVIPVGNIFQDLKVVDKGLDGSISVRTETSVRYVPLTSRDAQLRGS
ncbi:protein-L-isoaspartate O-methyltransferase 1-like [Pyrus ussuriensis x Pyrus communis]|uniref:Protein-L-isoaspartate O-methyltransferase n=1 Tax=Pyrus ussuriensis x Pyrus communis TaxID=2448454 RepID=A0A5N5G1I3_9ROSA|nr:protein-L-isoaspartate O-methyltransferase 1-like [Pyrus ussuriensis x Pyrus communis]